ncbi:MAG: hypothetical protein MUE81_07915 [Thermoflexibacter sp.]|nr:hypothetical protein [Thermoflexibacter sp.]
MKEHFIRLYTYNHWANFRYFDFLRTIPIEKIPERIHLLVSHVLTAQKLWLTRIQGNPDLSIHIWQILPWDTLEELAIENTKNWLEYLQGADQQEFDRVMAYENFLKIHYENIVSDIIIQCVNHATYHRAQYAVLLRQQDIAPPNTDFITFAREFEGDLKLD